MEFNRQLRFLIPPFVFFASLLLGAVIDPHFHLLKILSKVGAGGDFSQVVGFILAGGIAVIAMGFLISSIAIFAMRLIFSPLWIFGRAPGGYEATISMDALTRIWNDIARGGNPVKRDMLYAVAVFDHWKLPATLHEWCGRRWTVFMVCMNCIIALGLAHLAALATTAFKLNQNGWWQIDVVLALILLVNGVIARHQVLRMITFVAQNMRKPDNEPE